VQSRLALFAGALVTGGVLGYAWMWSGFYEIYQGFIGLFADPGAPLGSATAAVLLAFVMGIPRICVP
jgi:hypothetical protein